MFPLLLELCQQRDEPRIFSNAVEVRVVLKEGIAGESILRGPDQEFDRLFGLFHDGISAADVVGSVMEVAKTFASFNRLGDFSFRPFIILVRRRQDCLEACEQPAIIVRKIFQVSFGRS